jgi:hypothetical protein
MGDGLVVGSALVVASSSPFPYTFLCLSFFLTNKDSAGCLSCNCSACFIVCFIRRGISMNPSFLLSSLHAFSVLPVSAKLLQFYDAAYPYHEIVYSWLLNIVD